MNQIESDGRIAGVHVATLLRNLEDSTINEGSHDLFCRCKDAFAVLDSLLSEQGPRAGLYSLLSEDDSRAAGLAEAVALLPTIMADTFKRDDCTEEFLNGMAYGVASYCSAIKALMRAPASASTSTTNEERLQKLEQGAQAAQAEAWRTVCTVLEEVQPGWGIAPGTGTDAAVFAIRGLAARRPIDAQQTEPVAVFDGFEDCGRKITPRFRVTDSTKLRAGMNLYAGPTDGTNAEILELHRRLAAETLRADQGWQRYEAANTDRNALRASLVPEAQALAPKSSSADKLREIIAAAYQIAGAHDVPAHILDVLADPDAATAAQVNAMLPYSPAPDQRQTHVEWSVDLQSRLIDACTEQDNAAGSLMAEASCLLATLTPRARVCASSASAATPEQESSK